MLLQMEKFIQKVSLKINITPASNDAGCSIGSVIELINKKIY